MKKIKFYIYNTFRCIRRWIPAIIASILLVITSYFQLVERSDSVLVVVVLNISAVFLVSYVFNIYNSKEFENAILFANSIKNSTEKVGITKFWETFENVVWKEIFNDVNTVFIFVLYGYSWRNNNRINFQKLKDSGKSIVCVFPDFRNSDLLKSIAKDISMTESDLRSKIEDAIEMMRSYGAQIYLYPNRYFFSMYKFDDKYIFVPFKHSKTKNLSMPTFQIEKGVQFESKFYDFLESERITIINESQKLEDNQ